MPKRRTYDVPEAEFRSAVKNSVSLREIIRRLDLHDHTNTYKRIRQRIAELAIDAHHLGSHGRRPRRYSDEDFERAIRNSRSLRQALLSLGVVGAGGNYRTAKRDIKRLGLSTSHFTGAGWRKGETAPITEPRPLAAIMVEGSSMSTSYLRKRLLREGVKPHRCEGCSLSLWRGLPIPPELDHINGVNDDHRLENVRLLCPNCHAQTDTYRARNMTNRRRMGML